MLKTKRLFVGGFVIFCLFLFIFPILTQNNHFEAEAQSGNPSIAATTTAFSTYPASGAVLGTNFPINPVNFTTNFTDPNSAYLTWDSANCLVTYSGANYSNTSASVTNTGIYHASYGFDYNTTGIAPSGWTVVLGSPGSVTVETAPSNYHNYTLRLRSTSTTAAPNYVSAYTFIPTSDSVYNISFWEYQTVNLQNDRTDFYLQDAAGNNLFYYLTGQIAANKIWLYYAGTYSIETHLSAAWYYWEIQCNDATKKMTVWRNKTALLTNVDYVTGGTTVGKISIVQYVSASATHDTYYDGFERSNVSNSVFMMNYNPTFFLNASSQSFQMLGSYTYQFQAWLSGTRYDCPVIPFVVGQASPNVQLISNAPTATTWLFTNNPSVTSLYDAHFSTWTSSDYSNFTYAGTILGDSFTDESHPTTNYGFWSVTNVETTMGGPCGQSFIDIGNESSWTTTYFHQNETRQLGIYIVSWGTYLQAYETSFFEEMSLNWNNQPAAGATLWGPTNVLVNTRYNVTINGNQYINFQKGTVGDIELGSRESANPPIVWHNTSRFYVTDSLGCIQSDVAETLVFSSDTFAATQLQPGDMLNLAFNTSSTHQIVVELLNGGIVQETFELVREGNPNFDSMTVNLTLTTPALIDQLRISGLFEAASFQITDLTIERYTTNEYSHTYYVPAFGSVSTSMLCATYDLRVFQGNVLSYNVSIMIQAGILNPVYYQPNIAALRQVAFFDVLNNPLAFSLFAVNLTCTYQGDTYSSMLFGSGFSATFYADDESYYSLYIYDRFGRSLINRTNYAITTFINITLVLVFSLKIKNEMRLPTLLQLTRDSVTQSEYAMSGEIVEYTLWNGTYQLNYTQNEIGFPISINLDVTSATIYNISTAYRTIYFSCFSNDGLGVPTDSVRLYCNNSRKSWGPVDILGLTNITVIDYVGDVQYSAIVDLSGVTEMNIFVNIATVILQNAMRNESISIAIHKNGILLQNQTINQGDALIFRFTSGTYTIDCIYANGTVETRSLDVIGGSDLKTYPMVFGTWVEAPLPAEAPKEPVDSIWAVVIIACGFFAVLAGLNYFQRKKTKAKGYYYHQVE